MISRKLRGKTATHALDLFDEIRRQLDVLLMLRAMQRLDLQTGASEKRLVPSKKQIFSPRNRRSGSNQLHCPVAAVGGNV